MLDQLARKVARKIATRMPVGACGKHYLAITAAFAVIQQKDACGNTWPHSTPPSGLGCLQSSFYTNKLHNLTCNFKVLVNLRREEALAHNQVKTLHLIPCCVQYVGYRALGPDSI